MGDLTPALPALGFTFACGSAKLLAGCVSGKAPPFALDGLTLR
jgi:D-amino-acid dehydrogenase